MTTQTITSEATSQELMKQAQEALKKAAIEVKKIKLATVCGC